MNRAIGKDIRNTMVDLLEKNLTLITIRDFILKKYSKTNIDKKELRKFIDSELKKEATLYISNPEIFFADQLINMRTIIALAIKKGAPGAATNAVLGNHKLLKEIFNYVSGGSIEMNDDEDGITPINVVFNAFTGEKIDSAKIFPVRTFSKVPARIIISAAAGAAAQTLIFPFLLFVG